MNDLERLTDREVVDLARRVNAELTRRRTERRRALHERARTRRLEERVVIPPLERATKHRNPYTKDRPGENPSRQPSAYGVVLRVEGRERVVACGECSAEFRSPVRRGGAPRLCPTCKGTT